MIAVLLLVVGRGDAQAIHPRWELTIYGVDTTEVGDLRISGSSGRVLLQHADSAFQVVQNLHIGNGHIAFTLQAGRRQFEGTITDTLAGTVRSGGGDAVRWTAVPIGPPGTHWPVPPRVVVRQLVMGSSATSVRWPVAWLSGAPDTVALEREYRELAAAALVAPAFGADRSARAALFSLGLEHAGRDAVSAALRTISATSAADPEFRAIFAVGNGWKLDLHDAMIGEARHYVNGFRLMGVRDRAQGRMLPGVAEALHSLGELGGDLTDSAVVRQGAWRFWVGAATDSLATFARIDTLARSDAESAAQLRALFAGFDDATVWWRRAVSWLLTHRWLETAAGPRSPAQLMAAFWGVDSLPVPEIRDARFGGAAAMPLLGVAHIAPWLFRPGNAIAAEWLPEGGLREAFAVWRPLRWGESPPLSVVIGGQSSIVASPASQAIVHPASFFGERDAIRIDAGIMPFAAVAAFLHEWNHLLAAQRRLTGPRPVALIQTPAQLQLREEDPWLAEGFAEWATDEVLRPAGRSAALLRFSQAEKRLGIADANPSDPHVLGYRLVRTGARGRKAAVLRDLLVQNLHDPAATARTLGFPAGTGGRMITLQRPATSVVIPEISFTWDDGTAFDLSRRLVIPNTAREH